MKQGRNMSRKSSTIDKLEIVIRYLNYHGPLFLRNCIQYDSDHQKSTSNIKATIGT